MRAKPWAKANKLYGQKVSIDKGPADIIHCAKLCDQQYKYRAAAFSGVRSFSGVATGGSRVCSVVACTGDTMDSCGHRFTNYVENATAIFEELSIVGTVPTPAIDTGLIADNSTFFPVSSQVSIMPLEPQDYDYSISIDGNTTIHRLTLKNSDAELYTFALWGRVFATDGQNADPPVQDDLTELPVQEVEGGVQTDSATISLLSPCLGLLGLFVAHF